MFVIKKLKIIFDKKKNYLIYRGTQQITNMHDFNDFNFDKFEKSSFIILRNSSKLNLF